MADETAAPAADARPGSESPRRAGRGLRRFLAAVGYAAVVPCLGVIWFFYFAFAHIGGPDLSPVMIYGVAAGLGLAILAACVLRRQASVSRLVAFVALAGLYLGLLANSGAPAKLSRFHAAYRSIQVGMNPAEVQAAVDAQFPDRKMMVRFHPGVCFVGPLDAEDGGYNAEFFEVAFNNGVVTSKQYLPD